MKNVLLLVLFASPVFGQATYRFEEPGTTTVVDSSGAHHDATRHGATLTTGHTGIAAHFQGGEDHILLPKSVFATFENTAHVEAWVRPFTYPTGRPGCASTIFRKRADNNDWSLTLEQDGSIACTLYGADGTTASVHGGSAPRRVWTKVACTYDGAGLQLRINDTLTASDSTRLTLDWQQGYRRTEIGNNTTDAGLNCPDYAFHGEIDDVIIASRPPGRTPPVDVACAPGNTTLCVGPFALHATDPDGVEARVVSRSRTGGSFGEGDAGEVLVTLSDACATKGLATIRVAVLRPYRVTIKNVLTNVERTYDATPTAPVQQRIRCN